MLLVFCETSLQSFIFLFLSLSLFFILLSLFYAFIYHPSQIETKRSAVVNTTTGEKIPLTTTHKILFGDILPQYNDYEHYTRMIIKSLSQKGMVLVSVFDRWLATMNDPALIVQVLGKSELNFFRVNGKGPFPRLVGSSILGSSGEDWYRQHRILQKAFTPLNISRFFGLMVKSTDSLCHQIDNQMKQNGKVPTHSLLAEFAIELIVKAGFASDAHQTKEIMSSFSTIRSEFSNQLWKFPFFDHLNFIPRVKSTNDAFSNLLRIGRDILKERRKQLSKPQSDPDRPENLKYLVDLLLEASDQETNTSLTDQELIDNVCVFLFAGSETTANTICWMLHNLVCHPQIYEKLQREIDEVVPQDLSSFSYKDLSKLKYFNLVMKETMRFTPSVPICATRFVKEDFRVGDWLCKKGTALSAHILATHLSPTNYQDPERFLPERWEENDESEENEEGSVKAYKFIPFGAGKRVCIGKYFALLEIRVVLSCLLSKYKVSIPNHETFPKHRVVLGPVLLPGGGLNLCFERRERLGKIE